MTSQIAHVRLTKICLSLLVFGVWLVALPVKDTEACSCFEISPYYTDSEPAIIAPTSDLWVYVSPPYGATQVEAQVVLMQEPRPNARTRPQVRDVLASSTEHGNRADRHFLRIVPSGRWPGRGRLAVRVRYQGTSIAHDDRQWSFVRSYQVGGGSIARALEAWWGGPMGALALPRIAISSGASRQSAWQNSYGTRERTSLDSGAAVATVASSCGQIGPSLNLAITQENADMVLIYVDRAPTGFPDSLEHVSAGPVGPTAIHSRLIITSGDSSCGSRPLLPADITPGTTLWLVPVDQAGRRGEPVKVVVPT